MLGRAGMYHHFGWLGTVVLLAVGRMKECMGVTTLAWTLGSWEGPPGPAALDTVPPAGEKLSSLFASSSGARWGLGTPGRRECEGVLRGQAPGQGQGTEAN